MSESSSFTPRSQDRRQKAQTAAKQKKKKKNSLVLNLLLVFFCAVFLFAAYNLISQFLVYNQAVSEYDKVRQAAGVSEEEQTVPRPDFQALSAMNPEVVGWVTVPDTAISYPVVQAKDNEKYLHTTFEGKKNSSGCIFMDKDSKADASGQHTILYGHNMKNGSMFHELVQYKKADFFNAHPIIYYDTLQGRITLRVIAAYAADATEAYNFIFSDLDSLHSFVAKAIKRSPVKLEDVNANAVDKIFSLQTCSYETDNSRTYVLAVPVEE